jgi:hypothetical protein
MLTCPLTGRVLFTRAELQSDDGTVRLAPGFAEALVDLRLGFDRPMVATSACRTPSHNARVGGEAQSFHLTEGNPLCPEGACAIDIAVPDNLYRDRLVRIAYERGWSIGHYRNFLHLDRRHKYGNLLMSWWGSY